MEDIKQIKGFKSILELINYFKTEEICAKYLAYQRWEVNPVCPHCGSHRVNELKGKTKRYKCYGCRKQFSVRVGTILEDSKIKLQKWFTAIWLVTSHKKGIYLPQLRRP
tara:strand:- start:106 stop:432 length:327 start_codon:yes stop_codon:yes gene_type:complete